MRKRGVFLTGIRLKEGVSREEECKSPQSLWKDCRHNLEYLFDHLSSSKSIPVVMQRDLLPKDHSRAIKQLQLAFHRRYQSSRLLVVLYANIKLVNVFDHKQGACHSVHPLKPKPTQERYITPLRSHLGKVNSKLGFRIPTYLSREVNIQEWEVSPILSL
jgi:hypothetical protein